MLDKLIYEELTEMKRMAREHFDRLDQSMKKWLADRPAAEQRVKELETQLAQRKTDQQQILLERIRDRAHENVYAEMLIACEADITRLTEAIAEFRDKDALAAKHRKEIKRSVDLLESIAADGAVSDAHLRMLVDQIVIYEKDGRLRVEINLNGKFRSRHDSYDADGNLTERLTELWYYPAWEESRPPLRGVA